MKKYIYSAVVLSAIMLGTSCKKQMEGINTDPDNPTVVSQSDMLTAVEANLAWLGEGDANRFSGIYTQYYKGIERQFVAIQNYNFLNSDVNNLFTSYYTDGLMELGQMKEISEEKGYVHYSGVSKALEAYSLLFLTDLFGDIPYTEAFQGADNLQPKYDSQESIYNEVFKLLDEASTDLSATDGGAVVPGSEDFFYSGDIAKWKGFVSFIKAKASLHLAKSNASNYQKALSEITSNGGLVENFSFPFTGGAFPSPMYDYIQNRVGDMEIADSFGALLTSLSDPRADVFVKPLDNSHPFFVDTKPVNLATMTEQLFMQAECKFKTGDVAGAKSDYLAAIQSSFTEVGKSADYATYVAQASVNPATVTLEHIMTQKYIAMFGRTESFNDWRRTGIPALTPNSGSEVPRRFPYALDEVNLNANTPQVSIFKRVWWDN